VTIGDWRLTVVNAPPAAVARMHRALALNRHLESAGFEAL
jgi:hypothetical protein